MLDQRFSQHMGQRLSREPCGGVSRRYDNN
jgi:hypothetical protein